MTRTEPISYVEATIRALEEDNAELLAEIKRLRAALEGVLRAGVYNDACECMSCEMARAALAQLAAQGGDNAE